MRTIIYFLQMILLVPMALFFVSCASTGSNESALGSESTSDENLPIVNEIKDGGYYTLSFTSDHEQNFNICLDQEGVLVSPETTACKGAPPASAQRQPASVQNPFYRVRYYNDEGQLLGETCYKNHFMVDPKTKGCGAAPLYERFFNPEVANMDFHLFKGKCYNRFNQYVDVKKCQPES